MFGTDYTAGEAETQHILLREALTEHFKMFTTALVVVEEFDKVVGSIDCRARVADTLRRLPVGAQAVMSWAGYVLRERWC